MKFGERLLHFRAKYDLTQQNVAEIFGITQRMIYLYEANLCQPNPKNKIMFENKMKEWEENKNVSL